MNYMQLQLSKTIVDNDLYFIEVVSDKIIVNDNYEGILILDSDLNIVKKIKLLDEMSIDAAFVNNQDIVLYCHENSCLIYIDIETFVFKIIPINKKITDIYWGSLYKWMDKDLYFLTRDPKYYIHVNLNDGVAQKVKMDIVPNEIFLLQSCWKKIREFTIHKLVLQREEIIVETKSVIKLINYKNESETILEIEPFETEPFCFHDIEIENNNIAQISEKVVVMYRGENKVSIYPNYQHYSFLRGKFICVEDKEYFVLLSSSNSDSTKSLIEKYIVESTT